MKTPLIFFRDVAVHLGGRTIFQNLNLAITAGEFVGILGPNGAGKSTLLKLLLGLIKPVAGEILVLGVPPRQGNVHIGYAPQHRVLETDLALRARDVVGFGIDGHKWGIGWPSQARTERINRALAEVDALHLSDAPIGQLSGGEQQRLLIAQALITNPSVLLLDEPLSNLDIAHAQEIMALLMKLARERSVTILLVSHDINPLLPAVNKVVFVANGHAAIGPPDEVITSQTLSELYGSSVEVLRALNRVFVVGAET